MFENTHFTVDHFIKRETSSNWNLQFRKISNHELVFVFDGEGETIINEKEYTLAEDFLIYYPPNIEHNLTTSKKNPLKFYGLHFSFDNNKIILPITSVIKLEKGNSIRRLFNELSLIHSKKNLYYEWKENILINQILFEILSYLNNRTSPITSQRVNMLINHIYNQPCKKFTIDELCELSKTKKSLLIKSFKEVTGYTPIQFCIKTKIDYSKDLLINNPYMRISEISNTCGFDDPLYFSRIFKKQTGLNPFAFRKTFIK